MRFAASLIIYVLAIYFRYNCHYAIDRENLGAIVPLLEQRRNLLVGPNRSNRFVCRAVQFNKIRGGFD